MTRITDLATEHIGVALQDFVLTVTLQRPEKLNAVTPEMSSALEAIATAANHDPEVRVVILTGAGDRAFCAGSDIRALDQYATPWEFRNRMDYCDALHRLRKPVIAAVNGYALGGGLETSLICDIRLAAETARFAAPEVKLGWIGGGGMTAFLAAAAGPSNAAVMTMTGDMIDAETALRWGIVSEVLPADGLMTRARELAVVIASRPPIAIETAKANLRAAYNMPQEQAVAYERDLQTITFATEDAAEGRCAFAERRDAAFRGR
ncbi:enoyl-CoA hydratase/isomerase family protein [Leucobacter allii]|uniref:Enoyl-CoA hydratase/isomerase family protein n=1 Tax=Leucobacter allii TaxID=2932247 RepID=A0ABY4FP26_9MICO|nr:enoyl-CoA hydratase/isomerase family protein [Leucobacter allii]UOQ58037.1 enoyl-CoA hydratase/isomerase family protein [Leucobacter allii]